MTRTGRIITLAAVWGFLFCSFAAGQDAAPGGDTASLKQEINALKGELASVRQELQALRKDIKLVLSELKTIKTAQANPPARKPKPADTKVYNVNIGSSAVLGPKDAPVTIVEFGDFQCPYCIREYPKLKQVLAAYPDKVRLVIKHFPLSFHKNAKPAHAAAEFARREGGEAAFWQMHDKIIAGGTKQLAIPTLRSYAQSIGLDLAKFDETMGDPAKIDALLKTDMDEARRCGVRGTPTVLVNGLKLTKRGVNDYKARIDQILKGGK